ncbi:MAG: hypothetical protein ABW196_10005 [Solirubrobacterales bacterium]
MSQEALRELMDKAASDEGFAARLKEEPVKALIQLDLSSTELFTLSCADEDALRRLLGTAEYESDVDLDLSMFGEAALPLFDEKVITEVVDEFGAGGKTTKATTSGTKCCWG